MLFGSIVSSPRGSLSPQQALELANVYLENASNAKDSSIALVLCHDTEVALYQAKKSVKHGNNQKLAKGIATAYLGLGKLLESLDYISGAEASIRKAKKIGGDHLPESVDHVKGVQASSKETEGLEENIHNLAQPTDTNCPSNTMESFQGTSHSAGESQDVELVKSSPLGPQPSSKVFTVASTVLPHTFDENIPPPTDQMKLPEPDERLNNAQQLVSCLGLLKVARLPDTKLEPIALKWVQTTEKDTDEQERLYDMAMDVIRAFKREEIKDAKVVAEVVCLAPVLDKDTFRDLLGEFHSGIKNSDLLDFQQLEGLAQLIQGADHGYLSADDLVKILGLLSTRLMNTHQQSSEHMYQLTMAVSNVLDAMADTKVTDLDREKLHEPLSSYLSGLVKSSDPFLVYQAAYAYQALLCVPDDETKWQAAMRRTGKVIQGVSGLVSAVKGLDLIKFIEGLEDIQKGVSGVASVIDTAKSAYDGVTSLIAGGKGFMDSIKEGLSFAQQRAWYSSLRAADALIRDAELATFKKLICEVPCRLDPAFQWGVCQRLGEMAANPKWDEATRRNAIAFLGEIYRNDEMWGQQPSVKQWILNILMQLSSSSRESPQLLATVAETLLQELESSGDIKKQALYQDCRKNEPIAYPLKVALPELASPSLLDRVQNRTDVEGNIRILRKRRMKERGNAVYIQPQAKSNLQAADDTRFPLMDKVRKFLESEQKVFLLLGDAGAGKSTFGRELEFDLWRSYKKKTGRIPLHINLPTINKPELDMIAKQLRRDEFTESQIREMKHYRKFILICDGYDESQQTHNLYVSNRLNQPDEWDAQMVISCRSEYLGSDYRDRFQPRDRNQQLDSPLFQQAVMTPFSTDQIHDYIKQYVDVNQPLWRQKDYEQALNLIPSLKDLVKNPFLMTLSLDVLPRMVDPGQHLSSARVTRVALYDHFVEQWLERGKKRLGEKDMSLLTKEAFEKLSAEGFTMNGIEYLKKFSVAIYKKQGGHPVVEYSQMFDEGSWKDEFFSSKEKQLLREACPLTRNGNQHRFIHRSLLEYGLTRAVFDPQDRKNRAALGPVQNRRGSVSSMQSFEIHVNLDEMEANSEQGPNPESPLVWRSFVNDYSLLEFLEERVRQEQVFKDQLLAYIEHSKKDKKWRIAAANAITILVRAGVQFIGTDLRGIRIPGADLSYGIFHSAQLQEADMRKVSLRGAWLRQADLSRTEMMGVQFGELPYILVSCKIYSCAFSPDGKSLAISIDNCSTIAPDIEIYSTTGQLVGEMAIQTFEGHNDPVLKVVYSPDGNTIVSGSEDRTARIWIVESGQCQLILTGHTDKVNCVAYSPCGDQVASASDDKTIRLWDPNTGDCSRVLSGHEKGVLCIVYSPWSGRIASGSADSTVRLWSSSGECCHTLVGHSNEVQGIAFSQGDQLASASKDKTIRLWDVESEKCRHILEEHTKEVNDVVYSLSGDHFISVSNDSTVRVWDVQSGTCRHTLNGHGAYCIAYSPKADQVVTGCSDKRMRLWDMSVGGSRHISSGHSQEVKDVKYSPEGNLIASCSGDRTIRLWDAETGTCLRTFGGHEGNVSSVAFSPQGNQIGSGSADNTVRLWDVKTGTCQSILTGHTQPVSCIAYSPKGDQVASASGDSTVRLWNVTNGEHCGSLNGHRYEIFSVAYSSDGSLIATCSRDGTRLWNVGTLDCINTISDPSLDVAFSPQGDQLASASKKGVCLWNVPTGDCCKVLLSVTNDSPTNVAYSHKGDLLASSCSGGTVRLWDVASGQCRAVVEHLESGVYGVAWVPSTDVNYLVAGCGDGSVLKWHVSEEEEQCRVTPSWIATSGSLTVLGASARDAHGLTSLDKRLLQQRGIPFGLSESFFVRGPRTIASEN
ncbi:MAG: hypothetical protein J3Q66DRAFT_392643 [Benniella sp.]|nr:MAG: hypothetical protein J3Q66DRAFT_392643 [Benniella sp.]